VRAHQFSKGRAAPHTLPPRCGRDVEDVALSELARLTLPCSRRMLPLKQPEATSREGPHSGGSQSGLGLPASPSASPGTDEAGSLSGAPEGFPARLGALATHGSPAWVDNGLRKGPAVSLGELVSGATLSCPLTQGKGIKRAHQHTSGDVIQAILAQLLGGMGRSLIQDAICALPGGLSRPGGDCGGSPAWDAEDGKRFPACTHICLWPLALDRRDTGYRHRKGLSLKAGGQGRLDSSHQVVESKDAALDMAQYQETAPIEDDKQGAAGASTEKVSCLRGIALLFAHHILFRRLAKVH
jgi:hypothetical protein